MENFISKPTYKGAGVPLYNRIPEFSSKDFFFWSLYVDKKVYNLVKNIKEGV